jgi:hypothetical protein
LIITLTNEKINIDDDNFYCTFSNETLNKLSYYHLARRRNITYKFFISNRELRLVCPLLKTMANENVVLWPSIKLPFRKYPVYVYFYAVALYLSSNLSMREVAARTRIQFGLDKFSHSTLSRTLKRLSGIVEELLNMSSDTLIEETASNIKTLFIRKHWIDLKKNQYATLLQIFHSVLDPEKIILFSSLLSLKYFNKFMKFVI